MLGKSKISLSHIVNRVQLLTTACKWNSFSISFFCSSDTDYTISGENLKGRWVNTLLIDNDEIFVGAIT